MTDDKESIKFLWLDPHNEYDADVLAGIRVCIVVAVAVFAVIAWLLL